MIVINLMNGAPSLSRFPNVVRFHASRKFVEGISCFTVRGSYAHDAVISVGYLLKWSTTQSQTMPHPDADSPKMTNQSSQSQSPAVRAGLRRSQALPPSHPVQTLS